MVSRACGAMTVVLGAAGLAQWVWGVPALPGARSWTYVMAPASAAILMALGVALGTLSVPRFRSHALVTWIGLAAALAGVWRLIEIVAGVDLGMESTLLRIPRAVAVSSAGATQIGAMSMPVAINAVLAGCAVSVLSRRLRSSDWRHAARIMGTVVASIGLALLLGYVYERPLTYHGAPIAIAPNTAGAFALCGVGVVGVTIARDRRERRAMMNSLRQARTRLEEHVADRTRALSDALEGLRAETEQRRRVEEQYLHAQKIESIGRLAGGIAHDFNNLLTAILGYTDLAEHDAGESPVLREHLERVREAGTRAAAVTRQLLAFARRQVFQHVPVRVGPMIEGMVRLVRPLAGDRVMVRVRCEAGVWPVRGDPSQLEQVLMNLCVNARDAMPEGGELTIGVSNMTLGEALDAFPAPVGAGEYVVIEVRDTGEGISNEVRARLFEPFFTTKPLEKGTGLGLATSHGIVKQHGGGITVESAPGMGATFRVYLPRDREEVGAAPSPPERAPLGTSAGVVLVIDDDPMVLDATAALLRLDGWKVLAAGNGEEAIAIAAAHRREIGVVLSDTVMPGLSRAELIATLEDLCPRARIAFMSAYSDDEFADLMRKHPEVTMLRKPFLADELRGAIRAMGGGRGA